MPGTLLAGRYRLVSLLGRGGMGEVYRAEDTRLGQTVALKFLPDALASDPESRARFYAEVRLGRQVSHPNVCHIYDFVEIEGHHCLSMEFVDGEDLGSLLRRIGRLPADKATEVAREICAGLAAAHDKGIIHRDLKPANVMLDGQGRARITDFGIAALADEIDAEEQAGTPAYMAPEQRAGAPASVRSDVYALGLVLHETFTGKRWGDATRAPSGPDITDGARDTPADVARVIAACLAHDPMLRPASARAVMAALPGGDPLQAALAAGETPSPAMVAAAGARGDLGLSVAWSCLVATIVGVVLLAWMSASSSLIGRLQPDKSPAVLAEKARGIVVALGHEAPAHDTAGLFLYDRAFLASDARRATSQHALTQLRPGPLLFVFRQSPAPLAATHYARMFVTPADVGRVDERDPPTIEPGMATIVLDHHGTLSEFVAVPPRRLDAAPPAGAFDWSIAFAAAGLDIADFTAVAPRSTAPVDSDSKAAWHGPRAAQSDARVHVEAAAMRGKPVWFAVQDPDATAPADTAAAAPERFAIWVALAFCLAIAPPLILMIVRNLRAGRGDRRGASRLAVFTSASIGLALLVRADHVGAVDVETALLVNIFAQAAYFAGSIWFAYVAFEPYARRRWPQSMISWSRLVAGGLRDPMVGRDVLFGVLAGVVMALVLHGSVLLGGAFAPGTVSPVAQPVSPLSSSRHTLFFLLSSAHIAMALGFGNLVGLLFLEGFVRKRMIAVLLQFGLAYLFLSSTSGATTVDSLAFVVVTAVWMTVAVRVGLLGAIVATYVYFVLFTTPLSLDPGDWYFAGAALSAGVLLALAVQAFRVSLAGRPMFGRALLELDGGESPPR